KPSNVFVEEGECPALLFAQSMEWLHDPITDGAETFRRMCRKRRQNVVRQRTLVRSLFYQGEVVRVSELLPDFLELRRQQLSERGSHAYVREVVTGSTEFCATGTVVS